VTWPVGEFVLEASVSYDVRGQTRVDRHTADLEIAPGGVLTLISSSGLCQGPPLDQIGADEERGRRTFVCGGDTRYELRPIGRTVTGDFTAAVVEEEIVTECVEYRINPDGQRVCARTRETVVQRPTTKRARIVVSGP
jgi:hypothetical protein